MSDTKRLVDIQKHLKKLSWIDKRLYRDAITALPNLLQEDEQIEKLVTGRYQDNPGILVASNKRIIFINFTNQFGLRVEDFPYDTIDYIWWRKEAPWINDGVNYNDGHGSLYCDGPILK